MTASPVEQFRDALHAGSVERVRELLGAHAQVRAAVNAPIRHFGSRPAARAVKNLPLLDVLLVYGADLNVESDWWAGGFGLVEDGITAEGAGPLVARCLTNDPEALDHRTWQGKYTVAHDGKRSATREEIGERRGDVYRWVFDHNVSATDAAHVLGYPEIEARLLEHASPAQRLIA